MSRLKFVLRKPWALNPPCDPHIVRLSLSYDPHPDRAPETTEFP